MTFKLQEIVKNLLKLNSMSKVLVLFVIESLPSTNDVPKLNHVN
jgi:hypothetical protein